MKQHLTRFCLCRSRFTRPHRNQQCSVKWTPAEDGGSHQETLHLPFTLHLPLHFGLAHLGRSCHDVDLLWWVSLSLSHTLSLGMGNWFLQALSCPQGELGPVWRRWYLKEGEGQPPQPWHFYSSSPKTPQAQANASCFRHTGPQSKILRDKLTVNSFAEGEFQMN